MYNPIAYEMGSNGCIIRELAEFGRMRSGIVGPENVFDYTIGNPSVPAPGVIDETIRQVLADTDSLAVHGYTSAPGDPAARQAIADDLNRRFSAGARAENLFLGCGTSPELAAVFRALWMEGAEILTIAPYFPEYKPFVEGAGCKLKVVPADYPDFQIRMDAVSEAITERTVAIIINSPNNPSGVVYTRQTLEALAALLTEKSKACGHPIYIVADEPYRELAYGVEVPFIPHLYNNTIVCYSYSKSLSLAGERIGYIYIPDAAEDSAALYTAVSGAARAIGHICAPSIWQKVITRCAGLIPDVSEYDRNRRAIYEGLTAMGYEMPRPDGAFYLFVKSPKGTAKEFLDRAMQKDLLVVPGDDFGCPDYFRVCYCVSYDKILRSLPVFESLIREG